MLQLSHIDILNIHKNNLYACKYLNFNYLFVFSVFKELCKMFLYKIFAMKKDVYLLELGKKLENLKRIISITICFTLCCILGYSQDLQFHVLKKHDNSMFSGTISSIHRDSDGYLWIAATQKLYRYDGKSYVEFSYNAKDSSTLSHSDIEYIYEDSQCQLWFCSKNGLNLYNKDLRTVTRIYPFGNTVLNSEKNRIKGICQENDSIYWIASYGGGVCRYNHTARTFRYFTHTSSLTSIPSNFVNYICFDSNKQLWVGTESGGLSRMNTHTGECKNYLSQLNNVHALGDATVTSIIEDAKGILWVGTWNGGLYSFNPQTEQFVSYALHMPSPTIRSIVKGARNELWIATFKGVVAWNTETKTMRLYTHNPADSKSIPFDVNWSVCYDSEHMLWVGSVNKGVSYAQVSGHFFSVPYHWGKTYMSAYVNNAVLSNSELLMATSDAGVLVWNTKTQRMQPLPINSLLKGSVVYQVLRDSRKNLLICTNSGLFVQYAGSQTIQLIPHTNGVAVYSVVEYAHGEFLCAGWNTGLMKFSLPFAISNSQLFTVQNNTSLPSDVIWKIYVDKKHRIWLLTSRGMGQWNVKTNTFKKHIDDPNMFAMFEDEQGSLWCGTSNSELYSFDEHYAQFKLFHIFPAMQYYIAAGISDGANIWVSTQEGVIRLNKKTKKMRIYSESDGLPSKYGTWALLRMSDSSIMIGTANGPVFFNPHKTTSGSYIPQLRITDVKVMESTRAFANNVITLAYDEQKITIEFIALALSSMQRNINYTYKLEGFDSEPIESFDNKVTYTNLAPGTYRFIVSYSSVDEYIPMQTTELIIIVERPWWKTWWFQGGLGIFAVLIFIGIQYFRTRAIRKRNEFLEHEISQRTHEIKQANEQLQERKDQLELLNQTKNKLFSIIGHDLINPIGVIIQLAELLSNNTNVHENQDNKVVQAIQHSAKNAHQLLLNLLDWARSQQESVVVSITSVDALVIIESVLELHIELLNHKQIRIIKNISDNTFVSVDSNMLHTIIRNLLSNAIKYSYEQSEITISISKHDSRYTAITLSDTGMGMSEDRLQEIFTIKKQSFTGTANEQGTGLGLVIVKEFVSLLHGNITITSKPGEGTTCLILIPTAIEHTNQSFENSLQSLPVQTKQNSVSTIDTKKYVQHKQILIVDDDDAMRLSLRLLLEEYATIHEACSGDEAYSQLLETHPDLVISDIQMMHGGGIELCKKIKENASVSHIPIILLTAFGTETDMIEGLKAGADEYLSKPFNKEILLLKIQYVFKLREELHRMFQIQETVEVQSGTINSLDEKIIQKIITYIHEHIADPNLSVEQLSDFVGTSRSTLHRKMNALTNMTPNDFIRMIRLKKAAELLKTGKFSVSEVAYDTGFNDPRYFSKCFKEFFGTIPRTFLPNQDV